MSTSPQGGGQRVIFVPLEQEPEVTQEVRNHVSHVKERVLNFFACQGFAIGMTPIQHLPLSSLIAHFLALGYLYSSVSLRLIRPDNARAVLAAGCLLGGMDDLCQFAYETCRQSINVNTIGSWLEFVDTLPPSSPDGSSTPDIPPVTVFGHFAQRIRDDVFHFLVVTLPEVLEVHTTPDSVPSTPSGSGPSGREVLLQIFSRVPFEMFKAAVESPTFNIGTFPCSFLSFRNQGLTISIPLQGPTKHVSNLQRRLLK